MGAWPRLCCGTRQPSASPLSIPVAITGRSSTGTEGRCPTLHDADPEPLSGHHLGQPYTPDHSSLAG